MPQLIYALKNTTIDGFQRLPSPGFHKLATSAELWLKFGKKSSPEQKFFKSLYFCVSLKA
jgi:hypothetical protein